MTRQATGASLVEVLVAMIVAFMLATMMFQLFHQNERVIRDQTLIMEMQIGQGRLKAEQISEIFAAHDRRLAGPSLPPHGLHLVQVDY